MNDDLKTILVNVCCNTGEKRFCDICIMEQQCDGLKYDSDKLFDSVKRIIEQIK